jgi:hypothetical protein
VGSVCVYIYLYCVRVCVCVYIYIYIYIYMYIYTDGHRYVCARGTSLLAEGLHTHTAILIQLRVVSGNGFQIQTGTKTVESCFVALNYYENGSTGSDGGTTCNMLGRGMCVYVCVDTMCVYTPCRTSCLAEGCTLAVTWGSPAT